MSARAPLRALLLDLDDTLLVNPMATFIPAYFQALTRYVAGHVPPERLIAELLRATRAMDGNDGSGPTNQETFAAHFYPALGVERAELEPVLERFYAEAFPALRVLARRLPEAREIVRWAFDHDLQVAIATNPLFPRTAIAQRLEWAGVPEREFPYALVTTYEDTHATKSHPAYYREILAALGRAPAECLMVGDDWGWDIEPTVTMGMAAYWIADPAAPRPRPELAVLGQGRLGDFWRVVERHGQELLAGGAAGG
ncbi:MAG: HAD family hydrolase [Acidobacteriota bacterium]